MLQGIHLQSARLRVRIPGVTVPNDQYAGVGMPAPV